MFFCSTMVPTGNLELLLSLLWMCYVAISLLLAPDPETRATSLSLPSPQIPGGWGGGQVWLGVPQRWAEGPGRGLNSKSRDRGSELSLASALSAQSRAFPLPHRPSR